MANDKIEQIYKQLSAPFEIADPDGVAVPAIKWRIASIKQGVCVPYITAAMVKARLNEVLGIDGWDVTFEPTGRESMICNLTVIIDGQRFTRADVGVPTNEHAEKGMASDAQKRAAKGFGVGAYIDELPNYTCEMKGKFATTKKGVKLNNGDELTSYINTQSPHRFKLLEVYNVLPDELKDKHKEAFSEIYKAI